MRNKLTIQKAEERQRKLVLRIARDANELSDLNAKIAKMRAGKIKVPPPAGKKVKIKPTGLEGQKDFDDIIPSFGSTTAVGG